MTRSRLSFAIPMIFVLAPLSLVACSDSTAPEPLSVASTPTVATESAGSFNLNPTVGIEGFSGQAAAVIGNAKLPSIRGCFVWSLGGVYKNAPVFLEWWNSTTQSWVTSRKSKTGSTGCIQFDDISVGKYYHILAYVVLPFPTCEAWLGQSAYVGPTQANDYLWRTGFTTVSLYMKGTPDIVSHGCLNWRYV